MKEKIYLFIGLILALSILTSSYFIYNQYFRTYDHIPNNESLVKSMKQAKYLEVGNYKRLSNNETILLYSNEDQGSFIFVLNERMLISNVYFTKDYLTNIYIDIARNQYQSIFNIYNTQLNYGYTFDFTKKDQLNIKLDNDLNNYPNSPISFLDANNSTNEILASKEINESLFITIKLKGNQKVISFNQSNYELVDFENLTTIRNR